MKVDVTAILSAEITEREMSHALFQIALERLQWEDDDAGCDWRTDNNGGIYIDFSDTVRVAINKEAAILIDAYHILRGHDLRQCKVSDEEALTIPNIYD